VTIVADANIAIAVLNPDDVFHKQALRRCLDADGVAILNITWAESLIHPTKAGVFDAASAELDRLGFKVEVLDDETADRARVLRAKYGRKDFPIIDAVVVAFGIERGWPVLTCDAKWPNMSEASIERLAVS